MHDADILEQAMRATGDETAVARLRDDLGAGTAPATAIGRLLAETYLPVAAGSPLHRALGGDRLDPHWRRRYPPRSGSLWEQLELLRSTAGRQGDLHAACPYTELTWRRRQWPDPTAALLAADPGPLRDQTVDSDGT